MYAVYGSSEENNVARKVLIVLLVETAYVLGYKIYTKQNAWIRLCSRHAKLSYSHFVQVYFDQVY